jgi:hypothetical protein
MNPPASPLPSATRPLAPELVKLLMSLKPDQKIRLTQTVRVGNRQWTTTTTGAFRKVNFLATGLATQRLPEDDIVVVTVHFTKENGEHSSIAIDEQSKVELLDATAA